MKGLALIVVSADGVFQGAFDYDMGLEEVKKLVEKSHSNYKCELRPVPTDPEFPDQFIFKAVTKHHYSFGLDKIHAPRVWAVWGYDYDDADQTPADSDLCGYIYEVNLLSGAAAAELSMDF